MATAVFGQLPGGANPDSPIAKLKDASDDAKVYWIYLMGKVQVPAERRDFDAFRKQMMSDFQISAADLAQGKDLATARQFLSASDRQLVKEVTVDLVDKGRALVKRIAPTFSPSDRVQKAAFLKNMNHRISVLEAEVALLTGSRRMTAKERQEWAKENLDQERHSELRRYHEQFFPNLKNSAYEITEPGEVSRDDLSQMNDAERERFINCVAYVLELSRGHEPRGGTPADLLDVYHTLDQLVAKNAPKPYHERQTFIAGTEHRYPSGTILVYEGISDDPGDLRRKGPNHVSVMGNDGMWKSKMGHAGDVLTHLDASSLEAPGKKAIYGTPKYVYIPQ
jgi:hypothetical protein